MRVCPTCHKHYAEASFCAEDGAQLVDDDDDRGSDLIGQIIDDRYRILRVVGRGGMGEVYEAEHIHIHKRVAIKLLRASVASKREAVQRLHREARATSAIGHPNIVHIEDFGRADSGAVYLAMEWLDGRTAADLLDEHGDSPLPVDAALDIAEQVCAGLAAAHAQGVVHRDLKPANIFLAQDADGARRVVLLDFGIAKLLSSDAALTRTGAIVGTPYYMAPEQALDAPIDGRCDLYALGVILYEMVTGTPPFRAESPLGILRQHADEPPQPPSARAPERSISPALEALVLRCLAKNPDHRFADADALGAALGAVRAQLAAGEGAPGPSFASASELTPDAASDAGPPSPQPPRPPSADPIAVDVSGNRTDADRPSRAPRWRRLVLALAGAVLAAIAVGALVFTIVRQTTGDKVAAAADAATAGDTPTPERASEHDSGPGPAPSAQLDAAAIPTPEPTREPTPAPTPEPTWTHAWSGDRLRYTATVTPRFIRAGQPMRLVLDVATEDPALAKQIADREITAQLTFEYFRDHSDVRHKSIYPLDVQGRLATPDIYLDKEGKHHVSIVVRAAGEVIDETRFDVCVGIDPDETDDSREPRSRRDELCPRMNTDRSVHHHDHR